jgi:hypothetical protein
MWKQAAIDLFLTLDHAGQQFGLWDKDFNLLPAENSQRITDIEIWRAANQLIHQFPGTAQSVANERFTLTSASLLSGTIFEMLSYRVLVNNSAHEATSALKPSCHENVHRRRAEEQICCLTNVHHQRSVSLGASCLENLMPKPRR